MKSGETLTLKNTSLASESLKLRTGVQVEHPYDEGMD
jgi:hypothetical protein